MNDLEQIKQECIENNASYEDLLREIISQKKENKVLKKALRLSCDVLRDINYHRYNERDVDFESSFIKEAEKELGDKE